MLNTTRFVIKSRLLLTRKFSNLFNISVRAFAAKNKDGVSQSDKEVDKAKKTIKAASEASKQEAEEAAPVSNIKVIESIEGDKVK